MWNALRKRKKGYRDVLAVVGVACIRIRYAGDEWHESMKMKGPLKMWCDKIEETRDEFNGVPWKNVRGAWRVVVRGR